MSKKIPILFFKKVFVRYLKYLDAYEVYKSNCCEDFLRNYNENLILPSSFLSAAFLWNSSKQGYGYWNLISMKWNKLYKDLKSTDYYSINDNELINFFDKVNIY